MATTSSKAADNLLRAAQVPAPMFDSLKAHFDQSAQVMGAGWHGPTDIQTLSGLEASFCGQRISSASAPSASPSTSTRSASRARTSSPRGIDRGNAGEGSTVN